MGRWSGPADILEREGPIDAEEVDSVQSSLADLHRKLKTATKLRPKQGATTRTDFPSPPGEANDGFAIALHILRSVFDRLGLDAASASSPSSERMLRRSAQPASDVQVLLQSQCVGRSCQTEVMLLAGRCLLSDWLCMQAPCALL